MLNTYDKWVMELSTQEYNGHIADLKAVIDLYRKWNNDERCKNGFSVGKLQVKM